MLIVDSKLEGNRIVDIKGINEITMTDHSNYLRIEPTFCF